MGRTGGSLSVSLAVLAAAQLLFNPLGHAQEPAAQPPPPPQPQAEPQVQVEGQPVQDPNAPPQPYAQPYAPPYPPPVYGPIVTLRSDSPRARLQMQTALKWQDVCLTPCNVPVSPAGVYRVGGGSIRASESFNMPRPSGQVLIDAQVGSKVKRGIGLGLTIGGGIAAAAGGIYLLGAAGASNDGFTNTKDTLTALGVLYLVVGVVLLAVGIPLASSSTSVTVR